MTIVGWATVAHAVDTPFEKSAPVAIAPEAHAHLLQYRMALIQGLLRGEVEQAQKDFDPAVRLMAPYQATVFGAGSAALYFRAFLARFTVQTYERHSEVYLDVGSRLVECGEFSLTVSRKDSGRTENLRGNYLDLWSKREDGRLTLLTSAWSNDRQADDGDAFRFDGVPSVKTALMPHLEIDRPLRVELAGLNLLIEKAVAQHDAKLWTQLYADDAVLSANLSGTYRNRAEIERYIEGHVRQLPIFEKLDIRNDQIDTSGSYIIEYASHTAFWKNGASSGVGTGKDLRVWRREPSGGLKMLRQIGSYD